MSKKKKKSVVSDKTAAQADLKEIIDSAKSSLFELDSSYTFIEDEVKPEVSKKRDINNSQDIDEIMDLEIAPDLENNAAADSEELVELFGAEESVDAVDAVAAVESIAAVESTESVGDVDSAGDEETVETAEGIDFETVGDLKPAEFEDDFAELSQFASTSENVDLIAIDDSTESLETDDSIALSDSSEGEVTEAIAATALESSETAAPVPSLEGTELETFESAQIEELEFITEENLQSVIESILFATDRPVSMATIKQVFVGTNVTNLRIKATIETLKSYYASSKSGITLEDIGAGFQLRTKIDNMEFLRRSLKARPFKLSGPALEVLAIVAYKQPMIKSEIDEIRGVESGHLLRALMEKNLCCFGGKSELPGKPMLYETTRKFLEVFSLRNLKELPTLSQIDELLPEGIGDEADEKPKLYDITEGLSQQVGMTYSEGEEELFKITGQLEEIQTSTDFFEQEKIRQKEQRDLDKAQNLRDALAVGEIVSPRDASWLKRYEAQKLAAETAAQGGSPVGINPGLNSDANSVADADADADSLQEQGSDQMATQTQLLNSEGASLVSSSGDDEFDELNEALDSIIESDDDLSEASFNEELLNDNDGFEDDQLIDPEVLEANDLADIEG